MVAYAYLKTDGIGCSRLVPSFFMSAPMGEVVPNSEHKKIAHAEIYTSYSMFMYQEPIKAAINTMAINPRKITLQPTAKSESPAFLY